jgi:hypothetical protein
VAMAGQDALMLKRDPKYCDRCWFMTTTSAGLSALDSKKDCDFFNWQELMTVPPQDMCLQLDLGLL